MKKVYCDNCKNWYCKLIYWIGSKPLKTIYNYVKENKIKNCFHYKRKWYKFWVK